MRIVSVHRKNNKFKRFFILQLCNDEEKNSVENSVKETECYCQDDPCLAKTTPILKSIISRLDDKHSRPQEGVKYSAVITENEMRDLTLYFWMMQTNYIKVKNVLRMELEKQQQSDLLEDPGDQTTDASKDTEEKNDESENNSAFKYQRQIGEYSSASDNSGDQNETDEEDLSDVISCDELVKVHKFSKR